VRHRRRNLAYFEPGAGGLSLDRPLSQFSAAASPPGSGCVDVARRAAHASY
jgi:hypothetical protein